MKTVSFSQLHRDSSSRDPSPLESPKTSRPLRDLGSRSSNGSAPNDSRPLPSSFSSSPSNPRASSAPPDLPSKKGSFAVSLMPQSSSLPTLFLEPKRVASSVEESIEDASPIWSVVGEEQASQEVEEDQSMSELPSVENEDAYIDASASQGVALELEPFDMADNDPQERQGGEDEEVDQMQKEEEEGEGEGEEEEDEPEVDEVEQFASLSSSSSLDLLSPSLTSRLPSFQSGRIFYHSSQLRRQRPDPLFFLPWSIFLVEQEKGSSFSLAGKP
ncbi:hypothetical protein BDY24DRAFT_83851 [Mrakia frigida]|uniref:uncharacterized protein n=1 Tax=Mrakia frigida TaxID=29902 RepID=UPI003FCBFFD4